MRRLILAFLMMRRRYDEDKRVRFSTDYTEIEADLHPRDSKA